MKLPKLYRVVYVELEWIDDKLVNGEHEQDCGTEWIKAMVILNSDHAKCWKILDEDYLNSSHGYYWKDELEPIDDRYPLRWSNVDPVMVMVDKKYKHDHRCAYDRPTIKDQREWSIRAASMPW